MKNDHVPLAQNSQDRPTGRTNVEALDALHPAFSDDTPVLIKDPIREHESAYYDDNNKTFELQECAWDYPDLIDSDAAFDLAKRINPPNIDHYDVHRPRSNSLASSCNILHQEAKIRRAIENHISNWEGRVFDWEVWPASWEFRFDQLDSADPIQMLEPLRETLRQLGIDSGNGAALGFLHGAFDPMAMAYSFSLRGLASEGFADAVSALSTFPAFSNSGETGSPKRIEVKLAPFPLLGSTTFLQTDWPMRPVVRTNDRSMQRLRDVRELPEPFRTQSRLWMDKWKLSDLTFMVNLAVSNGQFCRTFGFD